MRQKFDTVIDYLEKAEQIESKSRFMLSALKKKDIDNLNRTEVNNIYSVFKGS